MSADLPLRAGGRILVDQLQIQGVDMAFGVPGESYLALLDALHDSGIRFIICRQEGGAAMMAEAYGKLTGRPGIAMVTRGPGATNASAGVHIARQDSTPMILFIGQVARSMRGREAFQEIDYRQMYGPIAKWVSEIDEPERIPEIIARAFHTACSGRPGPVVIALPEDMLSQSAATADAAPFQAVQAHPAADDMMRLRLLIAASKRPFLIIGGGGWSAKTKAAVEAFADRFDLPVGVSFRRQDYIDNHHRCYAGHVGIAVAPLLAERVKNADLLILLGTRLGEASSRGYGLISVPEPEQTLVHVHSAPEEIGMVYTPDLSILAGSSAFAQAALALEPVDSSAWRTDTEALHQTYLQSLTPPDNGGSFTMGEVMVWLRTHLPKDAILTNGAGNYCIWVNGFLAYRRFRTQLGPTSGSMGYGTPAAIAAKLVHPEREVIAFAGDGCFLMTGQEMATAAQYGLKILWIIANNGTYGTIRMHQERDYPARVVGTGLANPDFAALARAYGGHGETVKRMEDFQAAFERARAAPTFALLDLHVDPKWLTPRWTVDDIRQGSLGR